MAGEARGSTIAWDESSSAVHGHAHAHVHAQADAAAEAGPSPPEPALQVIILVCRYSLSFVFSEPHIRCCLTLSCFHCSTYLMSRLPKPSQLDPAQTGPFSHPFIAGRFKTGTSAWLIRPLFDPSSTCASKLSSRSLSAFKLEKQPFPNCPITSRLIGAPGLFLKLVVSNTSPARPITEQMRDFSSLAPGAGHA